MTNVPTTGYETETKTPASYITTAIPYVNAKPHAGFALELVQADVLARHRRARGHDVRLQTGTDENSLKNVQAAERLGMTTEALVAQNAKAFADLANHLDIDVDDTIRTSIDPRHRPGVERLWRACAASGDIYKKAYQGLYCLGCEQFYRPVELVDGCCPEHRTAAKEIAEENYFFRLSRYQIALHTLITSGQVAVHPKSRRNEILRWIDDGLDDISISRSGSRACGWGLQVPDDASQIIYVWFDALANYITALDYSGNGDAYRQFWQESDERIHVIGKGISRFHAVYWLAMLLSAGLPLPTQIFVHGYLTLDGQKIAKSKGKAVDPVPLIDDLGSDALRYFLLRHIRSTEDGDFSEERLYRAYDAELAGQLGNLVHRTLSMVDRFLDGIAPLGAKADRSRTIDLAISQLPAIVSHHLDKFAFDDALRAIWDVVVLGNQYIARTEPWKVAKEAADTRDHRQQTLKSQQLKSCLSDLIELLFVLAQCLKPLLPRTSAAMLQKLTRNPSVSKALTNVRLIAGDPLFPRVARDAVTQ